MRARHAETRADLEAILASPEGRAAVEDVPNFATGGATVFYDTEEVLREVLNYSPTELSELKQQGAI